MWSIRVVNEGIDNYEMKIMDLQEKLYQQLYMYLRMTKTFTYLYMNMDASPMPMLYHIMLNILARIMLLYLI